MELRNKKWTEAEFFKVRQQVLASWPTGSSELLNLDMAIANLKKIPAHKNFALKMAEAKKQGRTLVQPRAGVADIDRHIELMQFLEAAGADFLPSTIDSYTRQNRYAEAERGIEESRRRNR
ncbi:MAG TPA: methylaspartate mutase subunit E, partial [Bacilli bacterium]|nr:methylaspartate mutase subunit E [Bacilli bacterium]